MNEDYKQQQLKILNKALSNDDYLYRQLATIHGWSTSGGSDDLSRAYLWLNKYCPDDIEKLLKHKYLSKGDD